MPLYLPGRGSFPRTDYKRVAIATLNSFQIFQSPVSSFLGFTLGPNPDQARETEVSLACIVLSGIKDMSQARHLGTHYEGGELMDELTPARLLDIKGLTQIDELNHIGEMETLLADRRRAILDLLADRKLLKTRILALEEFIETDEEDGLWRPLPVCISYN